MPDQQGTVTHLRCGENSHCGRNPQVGYLDRPRRKGAPARTRNRRGGRGTLCSKGLLWMPWGNRFRGPRSYFDKERRQDQSPYPCLNPCVNDSNVMSLRAPYATTIWDYINRGMPLTKEGTLKPNEVYALTAFLLYKNGIIREDEVMDAQSLPKVKMPNRD